MTTLNEALVAIIQKTQGAVESGIDFLNGQLPDVIQQLLMWHMVKNSVLGVFWLIFVIAYIVVAVKLNKKAKTSNSYDDQSVAIGYTIVGGTVACFAVIGLIVCALEALQVLVAPKVWLIEYAASLVK